MKEKFCEIELLQSFLQPWFEERLSLPAGDYSRNPHHFKTGRSQMLCLHAAYHSVYRAGEHLGDFAQQLGHWEPEIFHTHLSKELLESVVRCSSYRGTNPHCVHLFFVLTKRLRRPVQVVFGMAQKNSLAEKIFSQSGQSGNKNDHFDMLFCLEAVERLHNFFVWYYPCLDASLGQTALVWDSQHQLVCDWVQTQIGKRVRPTDPAWLQPQQFKLGFLSQLCTLL